MYQAYKGYFNNGQFVSPESVVIPDDSEVYVIVLNAGQPRIETLTAGQTLTVGQAQRAAFDEFFAAIAAIDDEPITEEDIADFEKNRVKFGRELDL